MNNSIKEILMAVPDSPKLIHAGTSKKTYVPLSYYFSPFYDAGPRITAAVGRLSIVAEWYWDYRCC